jgi:hypothetical protein
MSKVCYNVDGSAYEIVSDRHTVKDEIYPLSPLPMKPHAKWQPTPPDRRGETCPLVNENITRSILDDKQEWSDNPVRRGTTEAKMVDLTLIALLPNHLKIQILSFLPREQRRAIAANDDPRNPFGPLGSMYWQALAVNESRRKDIDAFTRRGLLFVPNDGYGNFEAVEDLTNGWCKSSDYLNFIYHLEGREINEQTIRYNKVNLGSIPSLVIAATHVTHLELTEARLFDLPVWIGHLSNLTSLNVEGNAIRSLPYSMTRLPALTSLNLASNAITCLPEWFGELTSLRSLNISKAPISNRRLMLPQSFQQLVSLTYLDLSDDNLFDLPQVITSLPR